ncbi:BLUF domain-containing protein [Mucilaginibacter sp. CAU 1740]|uniref:BLUF domain-containing protein n=1 Tax=Mucilaginibacter sp. CAU 1740 TaxID=3140365 RepID=UPI00325C33A2
MNEPLQQIIYFSKAVKLMEDDDLVSLLRECRELNKKDGVTGMLLYIRTEIYGGLQGRFIQIIEGPKEVVSDTFNRIKADRRHRNVTLLIRKKIDSRDFPDWAMGFQAQATNELGNDMNCYLDNELFNVESRRINIPLEYLKNFYALRAK